MDSSSMSRVGQGGLRRWPLMVLAVVLIVVDLFAILVFVSGAADTKNPQGKTAGLIVVGVVIVVCSWLAFVSLRVFARRGRPEAVVTADSAPTPGAALQVTPPVVSTGRKVGGWTLAIVFLGIAVLILVVVIVQAAKGDLTGIGAAASGAVVCAGLGIVGLSTARTPGSAERARALAELHRAQAAATAALGQSGGSPYAERQVWSEPVRQPDWVSAPVDLSVAYRESCSELSWRLTLGSVVVLAAAIWGTTAAPGWLSGVLILIGVVPIFLLVAVVIFLPYGIRLSDGVLSIGAQGVPRAGRGWKRQQLPLTEVIAWTVCRRERRTPVPVSAFSTYAEPIAPARKGVGNWGNFTGPGVRDVLIVRVDPKRVPAAMPGAVMVGGGVQATTASSPDIGLYVIGTRHPQRLRDVLDRAMPSRRPLT